ncbi:pyruvate decarboxylase [Aspergillus steynii IBT 23096]|uniref:Pyruvate decarboxylase n=1 Tax=Aspergillus steynii IBT 23096 TaxID=1392250 RepID=A0A2I2FXY7_9EURO|nr:pyruvate decarboxylase [Aspergillus steynii IBT 23096]PLB45482.1 pyruvate decarboxylase [Aspergillus steynii IBT 23096]
MTQTKSPPQTTTVANYLLTRLRQLGIQSVFGVPGDYNLRLLDFVIPSGLHWVGTCNELNAAYAADAYARINGLSALITTFGVGELSAINGIAGAYAEKAGVIHIVGTPARTLQDGRALMHHTFADGDYRRFSKMAEHVTVAQTNLVDERTMPEQVDWALKQAVLQSRPVYIEVPDDVVDVLVSAERLESELEVPEALELGGREADELIKQVQERIYQAKQPLILVDGECRPLGILNQVDELVKKTEWPTWTTVFGKSLVNEELPNVYGHYSGPLASAEWKTYFETADLIINLGPHYSDTNTQGFATIPRESVSISFLPNRILVGKEIHRELPRSFLPRLLQSLDTTRIPKITGPPKLVHTDLRTLSRDGPITQKTFYDFVTPLFRPDDLILTETGTASHGGRNFQLPRDTRLFGAVTWLSIGYMLPATLGAAIAKRELKKDENARAILFIGDGSLQMSVQEISTIISEKLNVILFVVNNAGYTIERAIHGRKQAYNDIAAWRHDRALGFFGADEGQLGNNFSARTYQELETVLSDDRIQSGTGLRVIEVFMDREDVEGLLANLMNSQIAKEQQQ